MQWLPLSFCKKLFWIILYLEQTWQQELKHTCESTVGRSRSPSYNPAVDGWGIAQKHSTKFSCDGYRCKQHLAQSWWFLESSLEWWPIKTEVSKVSFCQPWLDRNIISASSRWMCIFFSGRNGLENRNSQTTKFYLGERVLKNVSVFQEGDSCFWKVSDFEIFFSALGWDTHTSL